MKITTSLLLALTVIGTLGMRDAQAECVIADAKLEEAILSKPEFRDPANRQMVKDLRHLRDSAFVLWTYGLEAQCNQLLAGIRELIASPSMGSLGGSDEDMVEQQVAAQELLVQRGGAALGRRNLPGQPRWCPPTRSGPVCGPTKSSARKSELPMTRSSER